MKNERRVVIEFTTTDESLEHALRKSKNSLNVRIKALEDKGYTVDPDGETQRVTRCVHSVENVPDLQEDDGVFLYRTVGTLKTEFAVDTKQTVFVSEPVTFSDEDLGL